MDAQHRDTAPSDPSDTMRAVVRTEYGTPDVVRLDRVPRPRPGTGEVLVQVRAAGLDRGQWHLMTGIPYASRLVFGLRRPKKAVLGLDVAGTVVAVGDGVTRFAPGEDVYGAGKGTFAEYAVAEEKQLAPLPSNLTFAQAAAVPVSAVTALQGLRDVGKVQSGQKVLITGASGGVGTYAVQLAVALGADVTANASTDKVDLVRALGANHVIDYTKQDFAEGADLYDLILDIAGNPSLARLRQALAPGGATVFVGGEGAGRVTGMSRQMRASILSPLVSKRYAMFMGTVRAADLEELTEMIEAGSVRPVLDRTYPLEEARSAIEYLVAGEVRGKLALTV